MVKKIKMGNMYINDVITPKSRAGAESYPGINYVTTLPRLWDTSTNKGSTFMIKDTIDTSDEYVLEWVPVTYKGKDLLVCDRCLLYYAYHTTLEEQGLLLGTEVTIDGKQYKLRALTGGATALEFWESEYADIILSSMGNPDIPKLDARALWLGKGTSTSSTETFEAISKVCHSDWGKTWNFISAEMTSSKAWDDSTPVIAGPSSVTWPICGWGKGATSVNSGSYRPVLEEIATVSGPYLVPNSHHLGAKDEAFDLNYMVKGTAGVKVTVTEYINGTENKSPLQVDPDTTLTFRLSNKWPSLPLGKNVITIKLVDLDSQTNEITYVFNKVPKIEKNPGVEGLRIHNRTLLDKLQENKNKIKNRLDELNIEYDPNMGLSELTDLLVNYEPDSNYAPIYTVIIDKKTGTCRYADAARGRTPATLSDVAPWPDVYPFSGIHPVSFNSGSYNKGYTIPKARLKRENFQQTVEGAAVGSTDDVMIQFPLFFWRVTQDEDNMYVSICKDKRPGFDNYSHLNSNQKYSDYIYLGAYRTYVTSNKCYSRYNVSATAATYSNWTETYASGLGGLQIMDYSALTMIQILYIIAYCDIQPRIKIGVGDTGATTHKTGTCYNKGMSYGTTSNTQVAKLFGLEGLWGCKGHIYLGLSSLYHRDKNETRTYVKLNTPKDMIIGPYYTIVPSGSAKEMMGGNVAPFINKSVASPPGESIWANNQTLSTSGAYFMTTSNYQGSIFEGSLTNDGTYTMGSRIMFVPTY